MVLEKTLERSNQSTLKEISPGISLEGMMLKLKLQYFDHLMRRVDSLEKTLMLGGIGGRRKGGRQRMRWLDSITDSMDMSLSELRAPTAERSESAYIPCPRKTRWAAASVTSDGPQDLQYRPTLTLFSGDLRLVPILGSVLDKLHFSPRLRTVV